jgi:hypothetical protein
MGIINCPVHGRAPIVETCGHVAEKIERRQTPTGHRLTILGDLLVCDTCFVQLGFDRVASLAKMPIQDAVCVNDERWQAYEAAYDRPVASRRPPPQAGEVKWAGG